MLQVVLILAPKKPEARRQKVAHGLGAQLADRVSARYYARPYHQYGHRIHYICMMAIIIPYIINNDNNNNDNSGDVIAIIVVVV